MEDDAIKQLTTLDGVGKAKAKLLFDAGYTDINSIKKASIDEIAGIKGIGEKLANKIKASASEFVTEEEKPSEQIEAPHVTITLDAETKRLLGVRKLQKSKKPQFKQTDSHKKKKLADYWRRPDGIHNKTRYALHGKTPLVEAGYGSPALVRGLHPSGFEEVVVNNTKEVESLGKGQAARIAHTVGARKRVLIEKRASELGLKILNPTRREE
ncbi:MAG: 50S ribosomal protein L32e [Candidatus Methanoperedens sp.]|nr:50S ribosomal protein L32e [Candidatus Methanoperedens sp.]